MIGNAPEVVRRREADNSWVLTPVPLGSDFGSEAAATMPWRGSSWTYACLAGLPDAALSLPFKRDLSPLDNLLIVMLGFLLIGTLPTWPHSASRGCLPSSALGLIALVVLVLVLTGRL